MPYTLETKDGIVIPNVPDNVDPNGEEAKSLVMAARQQRDQSSNDEGFMQQAGSMATGMADIAGAGIYGGAKQMGEGLSMLGGFQGVGTDSMPQSISNAQAMGDKYMPDYQLGADAQNLPNMAGNLYNEYMPDSFKQHIDGALSVAKPWMEDALNLGNTMGDNVHDSMMDTAGRLRDKGYGGMADFQTEGANILATGARMVPDTAASIVGGMAARPLGALMPDDLSVNSMKALTEVTNQPTPSAMAVSAATESNQIPALIQQSANPKKAAIRGRLESRNAPSSEAGLMLTEGGRVVNDPMSAHFDDEFLQVLKTIGNEDREKFNEMLDIKEHGKMFPLEEGANRPSDVSGQSLMNRIDIITDVNRASGEAIDGVAESLRGSPVDFEPSINKFLSSLEKKGATYNPELGELEFTEKSILGRNPAAASLLNEIVDYMQVGGNPDAFDVHELKRFIDDQVTYGKTSNKGSSATADGILKTLRFDIDGALDGKFPEYDKVNTDYSKTIGALNEIDRIAGPQIDIEGVNPEKAVGNLMRRIMSNAQSATALRNSLTEIDEMAKSYGGEFGDNLSAQAYFANELDARLGSSSKTSAQGIVESGALNAASNAADMAGALDTTMFMTRAALKRLKKNKATTQQEKFDKMRELLNREQ